MNTAIPTKFKDLIESTIEFTLQDLDASNSTQVWNRFIQMVGDIIFVCPDLSFIEEYSAANQTVFYYRFNPKPSYNSWGPSWATGAVHGEEVAFVFGVPLLLEKFYTLQEIKLSEKLMNIWRV